MHLLQVSPLPPPSPPFQPSKRFLFIQNGAQFRMVFFKICSVVPEGKVLNYSKNTFIHLTLKILFCYPRRKGSQLFQKYFQTFNFQNLFCYPRRKGSQLFQKYFLVLYFLNYSVVPLRKRFPIIPKILSYI